MSFKVTRAFVDSVLNDENIIGFMADVFPNKLIRDDVFDTIYKCIEPQYSHIYISIGSGSNGKTTFLNMLHEIFGDNNDVKIYNEVTRRELIIAKRMYSVIFIACNNITELYDVFEGDEWDNCTFIPHTVVFDGTNTTIMPHRVVFDGTQTSISNDIKKLVEFYKKKSVDVKDKDSIDMDKLIETAKNIGMCMCDSDDDSTCCSDSDDE